MCRALQAIYRLGMLNDLVAKELVTRYYSCEVSRVRAVMYEVLTAMHFQDEHVQFFLNGISYLGGNGRFTNETISLADGLKELNCEKSIKTAMSAISKGEVRFYADSKVYITLCQKATELHRQEVADFYVFMLDCFANNAEKVDRAKSMAVKTFFKETGTIEEATIDLCNRFGEKRKCYLLDTLFDDPATLEKVRIAYAIADLIFNRLRTILLFCISSSIFASSYSATFLQLKLSKAILNASLLFSIVSHDSPACIPSSINISNNLFSS